MNSGERGPRLRLVQIQTLQSPEYIPWYEHEKTIALITKLLKAKNQGTKAYSREKILHALQLSNAVHNALRSEHDTSPRVQFPDSINSFRAQLSQYAVYAEAVSKGEKVRKYSRQLPDAMSQTVRDEFYDALVQHREKRVERPLERRDSKIWNLESRITVLGLVEFCSMTYPLISAFLTATTGTPYKKTKVYSAVKLWREEGKSFVRPPYTQESRFRLERTLEMKKNFAAALTRKTGLTVEGLHSWLRTFSIQNGDKPGFRGDAMDAAIFATEKLAREIRKE